MVDRLLAAGADVNACADDGMTPLIYAVDAYSPKLDVVERLLEAGAVVNIANDEGKTPLMCAVEKGREEIVQILRKFGTSL